jgi:hypothetical protein
MVAVLCSTFGGWRTPKAKKKSIDNNNNKKK